MEPDAVERFRHNHHDHVAVEHHERRTRAVVLLTAAMMIVELVVGTITNSMALTADGWHMATHAGALGLSALAYWYARTRARAEVFSFGTGKVYALAGYTSAVVLGLVAILMCAESARRLFQPSPIHFAEALPVAVIGLLVNLGSAKLLDAGGHDDGQLAPHEHDHNLKAAYIHVMADAFTSVLAIGALIGGRYGGYTFLDPLMGIVGGAVIFRWSIGLCRGAARQLLDMVPSAEMAQAIRQRLEVGDVKVADLHLWDLAPGRRGCIVSLVTDTPMDPSVYRSLLDGLEGISHLTIEVQRCPETVS